MNSEELLSSIEDYNCQLTTVSETLKNGSNLSDDVKNQLETLQSSLVELIELSLGQLEAVQAQNKNTKVTNASSVPLAPTVQKTEEEIRLEEEIALFKSEIEELVDDSGTKANRDDVNTESNVCEEKAVEGELNKQHMTDISDEKCQLVSEIDVDVLLKRNQVSTGTFVKPWKFEEVKALEGVAVRAPYTEPWGGYTVHNAVVLGLPKDMEHDEFDADFPQVLVLFSQPTCSAMVPCRFYLSNRCHYTTETCQFSHGYAVPVDRLLPYIAPDLSLVKAGAKVLSLHPAAGKPAKVVLSAALWHPGTVDAVLQDEELVSVDCSACKNVVQCFFSDVVPLTVDHCDQAEEERLDSDALDIDRNEDFEGSSDASELAMPQWVLCPAATSLGQWEKYTRGVGSRLMAQMGYVPGSGLGKKGEGRVEPVPAYLYPTGVSLDRCMELREKSTSGGDLLQVEKRLVKQAEKQEKLLRQQQDALNASTSVFDIINNKLSGSAAKARHKRKEKLNVTRSELKADSSQQLNLKGFHLSSHASKLQKEVDHLNKSLERHQNQSRSDRAVVEHLEEKLRDRQRQLREVQEAELRVSTEQQDRRDAKKYCIF